MTYATLAFVAALASAATAADLPAYHPDATAPCDQIPAVYHWNLTPLFASDAAWDTSRKALLAAIPTLTPYAGKLGDPKQLRACLDLYFRLHNQANSLTLYPNLRQSIAQSDDAATSMVQSSLAAMDELMRAASFIRRDVLALSDKQLDEAYRKEPALTAYRAYLDNLRRRASRVLSPDAEKALSLLGDNLWAEIDLNEIPSSLEDAFSALLADIPLPTIKDEGGKDVQLTLSNYGRFRQSANREVRRGRRERRHGDTAEVPARARRDPCRSIRAGRGLRARPRLRHRGAGVHGQGRHRRRGVRQPHRRGAREPAAAAPLRRAAQAGARPVRPPPVRPLRALDAGARARHPLR